MFVRPDTFRRIEKIAPYLPEDQRILFARLIYARRGLRMLNSAQIGDEEACRCIPGKQHVSPLVLLASLIGGEKPPSSERGG